MISTTTKKTSATKAPRTAAKKAATTSKKATTAKTASKPRVARVAKKAATTFTAEQRHQMISEKAYFIAESFGFDQSREMQNWLEAENWFNATFNA